jgi:uncharacterized protein
MRSKLALFLLIASSLPLVARADDASKAAKIQEFFKVAQLDRLSAQSLRLATDRAKSGMIQQMIGVKLNADQQQTMNEFSDKITKVLTNALGWDALEPEYAKLYAGAYTEQQIDDLLAFYKSPTGQVMVEKTPVLMEQANAIVQQHMQAVMPQMQKLFKDSRAEMEDEMSREHQIKSKN